MSGTGENETGLRKILDSTRLAGIVFLLLHFYYYCYGCFRQWGSTAEMVYRFLSNISHTGLFSTPCQIKVNGLTAFSDFIAR